MSVKTLEILEQLKTLSLTETSELVQQIEITFNVDTSPLIVFSTCNGYDNSKDREMPLGQIEFDVVLEEVPTEKKIAILKVVRALTGLALKEAKDFVESAPKVVKEAIAIEVAQDIKLQLELAGAKVSLK